MSGLERKQVGANQSAAILFNGSSALLPVTRQKIIKLCETLKQDKLTVWLWFNSRGVKVTDFYGKTIHISGCLYGQSQALVFFSFIVPFLKDAIVKTLDEILETCRARGKTLEEPYIRETAMLLDGYLIDPIYRYMADIDRSIRGKGNPKSVGRKDVTDEIAEMDKFLDERKDEMIQGIKAADLVIISELIKKGESQILEFKETLEYDTKENKKNGDVSLCPLIIEEIHASLPIPPNEGQVFVPYTVIVPEVRQWKLLQNFVARIKNALITANVVQKI